MNEVFFSQSIFLESVWQGIYPTLQVFAVMSVMTSILVMASIILIVNMNNPE